MYFGEKQRVEQGTEQDSGVAKYLFSGKAVRSRLIRNVENILFVKIDETAMYFDTKPTVSANQKDSNTVSVR